MHEQPYSPRLRLYKPSDSTDALLGRLLYGRRPRGVWVTRAGWKEWPPALNVHWRHIIAVVCPHSYSQTDWMVRQGTEAELEELVRLVGGTRATLKWISEEQWREEFAAAMRGDNR